MIRYCSVISSVWPNGSLSAKSTRAWTSVLQGTLARRISSRIANSFDSLPVTLSMIASALASQAEPERVEIMPPMSPMKFRR